MNENFKTKLIYPIAFILFIGGIFTKTLSGIMGFAHVLNKRIYLLNEIPDLSFKDELIAI